MPSSTLFHTLVFAAGAVVGATAAASLSTRREQAKTASSKPIVDVVASGKLGLSPQQQQALADDVLKYGNPGMFTLIGCSSPKSSSTSWTGPISDLISRKAYTLGYDRRLRHPSWVCLLYPLHFCFSFNIRSRQQSILLSKAFHLVTILMVVTVQSAYSKRMSLSHSTFGRS